MVRRHLLSILTIALLSAGCKVSPPGSFETATMTKLKHSITVRDKDVRNPLPDNPTNIESGRVAFSHYCAACHGLDAQNTGVPFADRMAPPVPSLDSPSVQSYSDGQLHWIMENGLFPSGMPASKGILTNEELWSIVVYLRHLPKAGSLGEPSMYSGDDATPCPTPSSQSR